MASDHAEPNMDLVSGLIRAGQRFDARGWVLGTSGNFSAVVSRDPLRVAITRSGSHKGELTPDDILELDNTGTLVTGKGAPSAETRLHLELVARRQAGAVLHTHSVWSTFLSGQLPGGFEIEGYEMLKGLAGVNRLSMAVHRMLDEHPHCHGFLLRRHGLYTWGETLPEAIRHVEILEFLLESVGRARYSAPI